MGNFQLALPRYTTKGTGDTQQSYRRCLLGEECGGEGKREGPSQYGDMKKEGRHRDRKNRQEGRQETGKARETRDRTETGKHI